MYHRRAGRGFTLLEVMIAAMLSVLLFLMVSQAWVTLTRTLSDTAAQAQITSEARMAVDTLRRDLAGHLPGSSGGVLPAGKFVGRSVVGTDQLLLCFDGEPTNGVADWAAPDVVVDYSLDQGRLLRKQDGNTFLAARRVSNLVITELGAGVRIVLTLTERDFSRSYTIEGQDP